nr:exocyst complex component SEC8 [Ipomoea batatas]
MGLFDGLPIPAEKDYLRDDLYKINESWTAARFDSLPHVVHILTSKDREGEVQILKEQSEIVEDIVDEVVHAYHGGFNKAIQNYSQILRLFTESTQSIGGLKTDLTDSKKLLGARNKQLHQLWYRSVTLRHIIALLDQIEGIAKIPTQIEKFIADKQFYAAVQFHVQSAGMLDREGLQTVGALQDVKTELSKLRGVLFYKILEDLHAHLYHKGEHSPALFNINEREDKIPTTTAIALSRKTNSSLNGHGEDGVLEHHKTASDSNGGDGALKDAKDAHQVPTWLSDATPDEFIEAMTKSDAPLHVKYLQTMVECLCMLGKVAACGAIICQRFRPTIHEIITTKIKSIAENVNSSRHDIGPCAQTAITGLHLLKGKFESYPSLEQKRQNGISMAGVVLAVSPVSSVMAPTGKAQAAAKELLDSILDAVLCIFENHIIVGELLESKSLQQVELNTPRSMPADINWNADSDMSRETGGYSISFSLNVLQVSYFLSDYWYSGVDLISQGWSSRASNVVKEGYGSTAVLLEQGLYLAASLYRPVVEFTDKIASMLPQKFSHLGKDGLLTFVENFVKDRFLPALFVDYRKAVQQAIASPAAFRPRAQATSYISSIEKGRPVLQGLLAICFLAEEVLGWAEALPKFAAGVVTYVQSFLERTYERCRTSYMEAVLEKQSYMVIGRYDIENLMRLHPASAYLPSSVRYPNSENYASDGRDYEKEISDLLLNLRPIKRENLIRDDNKLVLLASLSDSLEYFADSIERLAKIHCRAYAAQVEESGRQKTHQHRRSTSSVPKDLISFAEEYRKLAVDCLKVLRIEMQLETIFHMQEMTIREYLDDHDTEEPDDYVISLTSMITRRDEGMLPFIAGPKRNYIFGSICIVAANSFIKALNDIKSINLFGVQQICRNSIALEQALAAIPSIDSEVVKSSFERVRTYYELLNMPFEALIVFVIENEPIFTNAEYYTLLKVQVPGREIPVDAEQRLAEILPR